METPVCSQRKTVTQNAGELDLFVIHYGEWRWVGFWSIGAERGRTYMKTVPSVWKDTDSFQLHEFPSEKYLP